MNGVNPRTTPLDQAAFGRFFFVSSLVKTKLPAPPSLPVRSTTTHPALLRSISSCQSHDSSFGS